VTTAFLFAGQGVDPPWIARDVLERPAARPLLDAASHAAGADVVRLLARGGRELADPAILQPALVAACLCVAAELAAAGVVPALVCGHSLGELAAWAASGCVAAGDAIAAAAVRGRLMARQARLCPGGMVAVRGGAAELARALAAGRARGAIALAAENAPDEHVVSGSEPALAAVLAAGPAARLPVAGAWHSPAMAGAVDELRHALAAVPGRPPHAVLVCNRTGAPAAPPDLPALLAGQLVHPVRWVTALGALRALGATRYLVVGPGKLVRALVRRTLGDVKIEVVDSMRDIARVAA
jgi:[acyl-carrier-protein] S-malonyltransferase